MDVGELNITGSIDEDPILDGINRIANSLSNIENQFNQIDGPSKKVGDSTKAIANHLMLIGSAGLAGLIALASKSPVLASTFARIQVSTLQLSNTLGTQFKPAFEGVNNLIQDFNKALLDNDSTVSNVATSVGQSLSDLGSLISGQWDEIKNIIPKTAGVALGIKLGAPFGLQGMLLGAALGYIAGDLTSQAVEKLVPKTSDADKLKYGVFAETMKASEGKVEIGGNDPKTSPAGYGLTVGVNAIIDFFQWVGQKLDSKETTLATATGVPR